MPSNSRRSLKNDPFDDVAEEKKFSQLNGETFEEVFELIQGYASDDENKLLCCDDCASSLKDAENQRILTMLIQNRRHLRLSIWFLVQPQNIIPLNMRKINNTL